MRGLHALAWRGLRVRALRSALTASGVALGVAVLFAGVATNAGIDRSVDRAVADLVGRSDLRVTAFGETGLSERTLQTVAGTPGVAVVAPAIQQQTYLGLDRFGPGDRLPAPVTVVGVDVTAEVRLHDLALAVGALPGPGDDATAVVSRTLAAEDGITIGSALTIQGPTAPTSVRVVGILADDGPWADAGGRSAIMSLAAARQALAVDGLSRIDIGLEPDAVVAQVETALQDALLTEPYLLSSPADVAAEMRASTADFVATTALIAAIALFTGAFLIFNTLSMTVVERVRELGLLRAAGARRGQLTSFILVQGLVIGAVGSVLGIGLGIVLAVAITLWVGTIGSVDLAGPVVTAQGTLLAIGIGLAVTLAGALEPARRASRIPPVEALKARLESATARQAHLRWLVAVFGVIGIVGLVGWPRAAGDAALIRAFTVYAGLLVVVLLVPVVLPGLARLAGIPFGWIVRFEERLARASILRDRSRASLTVGALTIGLALVVALGGIAQHARSSAGTWIADVMPGDLLLTSIFPRDADEGLDETLSDAGGVVAVSPLALFALAIDGTQTDGAVMVGGDLHADGRLTFVAGEPASALAALDAGGSTIIPRSVAIRDGLVIGDRLAASATDGSVVALEVVGIAERTMPGPTGEAVLVGWNDAGRLGVAGADAYAVRFRSDATAEDRAALVEDAQALALEAVPVDRINGAIGEALDRVFGLFDALALIAVVVAALGIVNTLTMNVMERVREIGVLRAVGMTRRQIWRSVVVEAGVTGAIGAICGVAAGLLLGALMIAFAGGSPDPATDLPWVAVGAAFGLGIGLAMLAAAYPARLASRVSIVRAVEHE